MRCFYHLGSLALGALIIAIIQIFRAILNYIDRKTKRTQNGLTKCLVCFCKCCLWCLEKCLRYLSKNAYILTAIYGYGFCKASCKAVKVETLNLFKNFYYNDCNFENIIENINISDIVERIK